MIAIEKLLMGHSILLSTTRKQNNYPRPDVLDFAPTPINDKAFTIGDKVLQICVTKVNMMNEATSTFEE